MRRWVLLLVVVLGVVWGAVPAEASSRHHRRTIDIPLPTKPEVFGGGLAADQLHLLAPTAPGAIPGFGAYFRYVAAGQVTPNLGGDLVTGVSDPIVSASDFHSLEEISVTGPGNQIVEVGWIVDPSQFGDAQPHLFVFHWVNGQPTCYNGCGFVPFAGAPVQPGSPLPEGKGPYQFSIQWNGDGWATGYGPVNNFAIFGYFPESLWSSQGATFQQASSIEWFGEVSESGDNHTQMGNGRYGGKSGAARVAQMRVEDAATNIAPANAVQNLFGYNSQCYSIGNLTATSFTFGGSGC